MNNLILGAKKYNLNCDSLPKEDSQIIKMEI